MDSPVDGLAVINGEGMHHYKDCGLDYVWLKNGFKYRDTTRGRLVSIHDSDGLHAAIARWIIRSPALMRGQEIRFLRSMLGLSQEGFGKLIRKSRATVARLEGNPDKAIPSDSDRWLRIVYARRAEGDAVICKLVDLLTEIDEVRHGKDAVREARFRDDGGRWLESRRLAA